jgi:hypothetical protein
VDYHRGVYAPPCKGAVTAANPIVAENACPGNGSWKVDHSVGTPDRIEGFVSPVSAAAGQTVNLYVSTTAQHYWIRVYRMGWYNGLGARLVYSVDWLQGIQQPAAQVDPTTHEVHTAWREPVPITIPAYWVSGVYFIKLVTDQSFQSYVSFDVRDDTNRAPTLFLTGDITNQTYNLWGGYSLYFGLNSSGKLVSAQRAHAVSFDRPYYTPGVGGESGSGWGTVDYHMGLSQIIVVEWPLLRWLERSGYDVSYASDVDADLRGAALLTHKLVIYAGHDEYWSTAMRANTTAARDAGVSLAFFAANDSYWHIRLQAGPLGPGREVVCWKDATLDPIAKSDPAEVTYLWRAAPLNQPENSLLGQMYGGAVEDTPSLTLADGAAPFLRGTTLSPGASFPHLVGGEYDRVYSNGQTPPGLTVIAATPLVCVPTELCPASGQDVATATLYTAPSGARVFDAGTFQWTWGLDDTQVGFRGINRTYADANFQAFTANLLNYLLRVPGS